MRMKCSGKSSSDVDVRMQLNVSIFSPVNFTSLDIRRKKTCLRNPALGITIPSRSLRSCYNAGFQILIHADKLTNIYFYSPLLGQLVETSSNSIKAETYSLGYAENRK